VSTKAELIKDSMLRIQVLELKLQLDPGNAALKELLASEREILEAVKGSD